MSAHTVLPEPRSSAPSTPRISKDPTVYGVEFRCVDGVIQWRHTPPCQQPSAWRALTEIRKGKLVCELGWTPKRLRIWAGLLERPERRRATVARSRRHA